MHLRSRHSFSRFDALPWRVGLPVGGCHNWMPLSNLPALTSADGDYATVTQRRRVHFKNTLWLLAFTLL